MAPSTSSQPHRARLAGVVVVLVLEAALAVVDVLSEGGIVFTSAYLIAPLVLALFARPAIVAAAGALSFALAVASGAWNHFLLSPDHTLRCATVGLAALLALLSARSRSGALQARAQTEAARRAADSARERLDVVLGALAEAVTVHDERGKTVYANDAAVRLLGAASIDELLAAKPGAIAARFAMTREDGSVVAVDELPGRRAVLGEPAEPTLTHSVNLDSGQQYWLLTKATVVHDEAGRPLAVNIIQDVTAAKEAERRQRFLAQTLQESLLPSSLPRLAGLRAAASYHAGGKGSTVGGDFYDLFAVDGGAMVLLGDVTGKGVDAAAMTALVRHTAKTAARFDSRPSEVMRVVDEILREQPLSLVTLVCARLRETEAGESVELASGGHPLPLLVDREGAVRTVGREGLVLGAIEGGSWSDFRFVLAPGETLLFYSDGATDAPGEGDRFGDARLARAAAGAGDPDALVARVDKAIERFQAGREGDDRALLAIQHAGSAVGARPR